MKNKQTLRILKEFKHLFDYFMVFYYDAGTSLNYLRVLVNEIKKPNNRLESLFMTSEQQLLLEDNPDVNIIDWEVWSKIFDYKETSKAFKKWEHSVRSYPDFLTNPDLEKEWEKLRTTFLAALNEMYNSICYINTHLSKQRESDLSEPVLNREKEVHKYEHPDKYHLFDSQIDVDALYATIKNDILPHIKTKNHWFALWTVLKNNRWIKNTTERQLFENQMIEWFGSNYKKGCMNTYASTYLDSVKWQRWSTIDFLNDFQNRSREARLIEQNKISVKTVKKLAELCELFESFIKENCIRF